MLLLSTRFFSFLCGSAKIVVIASEASASIIQFSGEVLLISLFRFGDISSFPTVALISWLLLSFMVAFI